MSKYEILERFNGYQYTEGCPVFITGGNLLKDNETKDIYVQLKFKSLSEKVIRAVSIRVDCMDIDDEVREGIKKYSYLDMKLKLGEFFGNDSLVPCPDNGTRNCTIKIISVNFEDGSRWTRTDDAADYEFGTQQRTENWEHSKMLNTLKGVLRSNGVNTDVRYVPAMYDKHWICTCGCINSNSDSSCICGAVREKVFSAFDIQELKEKYDYEMKEERRKRAEDQRRKDEEEAKRKAEEERRQREAEAILQEGARRKKIAIAVVLGIVLLIIIINAIGNADTAPKPRKIEIAGKEYLSDTTSLDLSGQNLDSEDIEPLKKFTNLRYLDLSDNNITDISCLSELASLRDLYLYNNDIENIEPLARLNNLETLNLSCNNITDIEPLSRLINMKELWLSYNNIVHIDAISEMNDVEVLVLDNNKINNLWLYDIMKGKTQLKELYVNDNPCFGYSESVIYEYHPNIEVFVDD